MKGQVFLIISIFLASSFFFLTKSLFSENLYSVNLNFLDKGKNLAKEFNYVVVYCSLQGKKDCLKEKFKEFAEFILEKENVRILYAILKKESLTIGNFYDDFDLKLEYCNKSKEVYLRYGEEKGITILCKKIKLIFENKSFELELKNREYASFVFFADEKKEIFFWKVYN